MSAPKCHGLEKQLHDTEIERDEWKMTAGAAAADYLSTKRLQQARIVALESLVAVLAETNHDTHGTTGPWRKCDFASCMTAARALLSPAPADGTA